jgi:plasmid stability protein
MTSKIHTGGMAQTLRRSTIYLDPALHRALRIKAAETDRSISDLISDAVKSALAEDAEDLQAFEGRGSEPDLLFETVVKALKADGKI